VLHQIGAGALGPVFLARDPDRSRSVAVKVFRLDITPEQAGELAAQLATAARSNLTHPSIVAPLDAGVEGSVAYLVTDFISAEALDAAIRQYGPAPPAQAMRILTSAAAALDFAAAAGVNHGALHPRDVLVSPDDTHISGLGVGRALETIGLRAPMRRPYVAPERAQREGWDTRADVYSLGVLARELLVGRSRADRETDLDPRLPEDQATRALPVLVRATAARPADRFQTALEFVGALQDALGGGVARAAAAGAGPDDRRLRQAKARHATHDLLLPLDSDAGDEPAELPAPPAEIPGQHARVLLQVPPGENGPLQPTDALAQLDIDRDRADEAQPAEALELSDTLDRAPGGDTALSEERFAAEFVGAGEPDAGLAANGEPERGPAFDVRELVEPEATRRAALSVESSEAPTEAPSDLRLDAVPSTDLGPGPLTELGTEPPGPTAGASPDLGTTSAPALAAVSPREPSPSRRRHWALVVLAMLLVGFVLGAVVGYLDLFGVKRPDTSADNTQAPTAATTSAAQGQQPGASTRADVAPAATPLPKMPPSATSVPAQVASSSGAKPGVSAAATAPSGAKPAPAAPPKISGTLVVRSTPRGASVTVNGRSRGVTPLRLQNLSAGKYSIRVSRRGYVSQEREVVLSAGKPASTLALSLQRSNRAGATPASETATRGDTTFFGSLTVDSLPAGAQVFLDGRLLGTTPLAPTRIPAGSHVVRVNRTGFQPWTTAIQVASGQRVRVTASLERESS
jgi:serine/threonine-protein kinase